MLAVVIPYYKISFFKDTLESLANQTNQNFRLYIGNDASPEDPTELLRQYEDSLDMTYQSFNENLGKTSLTKHWERCVDLAEDEKWIMILCDDDTLGVNVIEEFYKNLEEIKEKEAYVITFATQVVDENGTTISKIFENPRIQSYSDYFYKRFFSGSRSSLSEHIFSQERYNKYRFRDLPLAWHSDDLAWLEFSEFGPIYSINSAIVYFRLSQINISRPGFLLKEKDIFTHSFFTILIKEFLPKFKKEHIADILRTYEVLGYKVKRTDFNFWWKTLPVIYEYIGIIECLKFTRRFILNKRRHGTRSFYNYSQLQ